MPGGAADTAVLTMIRSRSLRRFVGSAAASGLVVGLTLLAAVSVSRARDVDHYVLALSWSPTFCMTADRERERLQCDPSADHTFIVHGLWPNAGADRPAYCTPTGGPSRRTMRSMLEIMPSPGLIGHQWRKHGTCSGMDAAGYFATVRRAAAQVSVPARLAGAVDDLEATGSALRNAFLRANPDLGEGGITIHCRNQRLVEVRLCMTLDLSFMDCPVTPRRRCDGRSLRVPAPE